MFVRARDECAALREILIPDWTWTEYRDFCSADPDEACHAPVTYLAFKRRYLARLTEPIHLFCLTDGAPQPSLTNQYRRDLAECWMINGDVHERYRDGRKYLGRLMELLFAAWLHHEGWRIEALEAFGAGADVVATGPDRQSFSFEVKYLAQDEVLFELGVKALSEDGFPGGWIPVYSPIDYLLFRIFQAAKQLRSSPCARIVVAILANYDVYFAMPLSERWIDWQNPKFIRRENGIENFLEEQYKRAPNLDHDMKHYISQIDQVWFYDIRNGFILRRRRIDEVRGR